ncbi:MAG: metal ABC transporter permease [Pseudomonadales bacterium]
MRRALLGCLLLSLSSAPVGVFLILRRMSLSGDAISHAILPGTAIGFAFAGLSVFAMTLGGLIAGALVVALSGAVSRNTRTSEESTLAAFYLSSMALGVMIISLRGDGVDLLHFLFGSVLALDDPTLYLLFICAAITLLLGSVIYRPLVLECSDPEFFSSISRSGAICHTAFLLLVVLNLVAGFYALGTLMSVGLLILPGVTARCWSRQLEPMLLLAAGFSFTACALGLLASFYFSLATSSSIVLCAAIFYFISIFVGTASTWRNRAPVAASLK